MFQSFTNPSDGQLGPSRLAELRSKMSEVGIDAYVVPHADEQQNEYLPPHAERLAWLTGFTGSAGMAIVTHKQAVLFVDGRYTVQAADQVETDHFSIASLIETPPPQWIGEHISDQQSIGFDPWLLTITERERFERAAKSRGATLVETSNLVDEIWSDQPAIPLGRVDIQELEHAGKLARTKIAEIEQSIARTADCCVLTDPASIAWLFNIRGSDVAHNPVALSWCLITPGEEPVLFIDKRKLPVEPEAYLTQLARLLPPGRFDEMLPELIAEKRVMLDPALVPSIIGSWVNNAKGTIIKGRDPVVLPRAVKNEVELQGARNAHVRDGIAMSRFLHWLDTIEVDKLDEILCAQALEQFRRKTAEKMGFELKEIAFDTISGFGPNGAIVHYRVSDDTNRSFEPDNLYLVDSGGQYIDGTTDITRTIAIGTPSSRAIRDFTLVLKGHIAIATTRFPPGTRGVDLDVLARNALWQHGLDYGHGTGHGIGSYLNVHEGPQGISRRAMEPLQPNMIVSNEPGYYREGEYGIRIENLLIVRPATAITDGDNQMHAFETITLAPIDRRLIDAAMLNDDELEWLNTYHKRVWETLSPNLSDDPAAWLAEATKPILRQVQ